MKKICLVCLAAVLALAVTGCGGGSSSGSSGSIKQGIKGITTDSNGTILSLVTVDVYNSAGVKIATATTDSKGTYSIEISNGTDYQAVYSKTGYQTVNYNNIDVAGVVNLENVYMINDNQTSNGNISGTITNALDGQGITEVTINLRAGIGTASGTIVATETTDSQGNYSFSDLPAGNYSAELSKTDFITTYFTVRCIGDTTTANQNYTISPSITSTEFRIILTWGETPEDLDAHLTGPKADGDSSTSTDAETGRFHVYFDSENYSYNGTDYVNLDVDDVDSYGPETITITQQTDGVYRYSVHDYTNADLTSSSALSLSGAQVKVYNGSVLIATYNVPANTEGTLWQVFELNGSTITALNQMMYTDSLLSFSIGNTSSSARNEMKLIKNLPKKK